MKTIKKIETYGFECQAGPLVNCQDWLKLKDQHERLIWFGEASAASGNPELQKFLDELKSERDRFRSALIRIENLSIETHREAVSIACTALHLD